MTTLNDNTEVPSYLSVEQRGSEAGSDDLLNNYVMRVGEIRDIIYPTDNRSIGKLSIEYEVEVQHRDGSGVATSTIYRGVTASTLFGSLADRLDVTYRKDSSSNNTGVGDGSKVLLLCLSGDQSKAIIIGGFDDRGKQATNNGHHLFFEFNGAQLMVDKEGQIDLVFKGATKADGSLADGADTTAEGSKLSFTKDGSILLQTNNSNRSQFIKLDHTAKTLDFEVAEAWNVDVDGRTDLKTGGTFFIESTGDAVQINSDRGTFIGSASDQFMLGTTYRQAEGIMNGINSKALSAASILAQTAGTSLQTAAPMNAVPMVGGILAMPSLIAASAALLALGQMFNTMSQGIDQFEGNASKFLSTRNWND